MSDVLFCDIQPKVPLGEVLVLERACRWALLLDGLYGGAKSRKVS